MIDYFNIGLDFGTHQSKICIEDTADPRNRIYSFFKFSRPDGGKTFFLPSVVQINKDNTISYGFVDESKAQILGQKHSFDEPVFNKPQEPEYLKNLKQPLVSRIPSEEEYLATLSKKKRFRTVVLATKGPDGKKVNKSVVTDVGPERYRRLVSDLELRNKIAVAKWDIENVHRERINSIKKERYEAEYEIAKQNYLKKHAFWERSLTEEKAVYKYFKIALFSKNYKWKGNISPKLLSTWYLTYVLFCLFEEYPDEVSFQMGIPESIGDPFAETQRKIAEEVFYTAYRLYKLFIRKEDFLSSSVDYLRSVTNFQSYEIDYSKGSHVLVLPEAFAGLLSISQQGKIGIGMTLLVDIGGGSTDISLFNVISNRNGSVPNISRIISIHHGLNHIYNLYKEAHYEMDIEEIRKLFAQNPSVFENEIDTFRKEIVTIVKQEIYLPLVNAALKQGISLERLWPIIAERPVIFSGGGGVYNEFHKSIHIFSDPVSVSKDLVSLKNVIEKHITDEELSILSVAYGLSIPQVAEPVMTPLTQLFSHIQIQRNNTVKGDADSATNSAGINESLWNDGMAYEDYDAYK